MTRVTSLRRLALAASIGIAIVCAINVWSTFINQPADPDAQLSAALGQYAALLVAGVLFVAWLGRARRNLVEFKGEARAFGPGWTVGAWFIPIANLVLPPLVTADVAKGSTTDPATRRKLVALVWVWWICYLGNTVSVLGVNADRFNLPQLAGTASYVASGVLAMVMMFKVAQAQGERFDAVTEPNPADFPAFTVDDVKAVEAG